MHKLSFNSMFKDNISKYSKYFFEVPAWTGLDLTGDLTGVLWSMTGVLWSMNGMLWT